MSLAGSIKRAMRPSLRQALRGVQRALSALVGEISAHLRHGGRLARQVAGQSNLLLNIGCGGKVVDGWMNLDASPVSPKAIYFDALNALPIADGAVARIHCEHFLEHLEFDDAARFLAECCRVLRPDGGSMRIIVPDAERYMKAYANAEADFFGRLKYLGNASRELETSGIICNQMFRMGGDHKYAWDFETLKLIGRRAGFGTVERSSHRAGPAAYDIDALEDWRPLESLYCELVK